MANIALIFPGQGSQSVGMLKELSDVYPAVRQRFNEASDILNIDLWDIVQNNTNNQIGQTDITQPILLAAGISCFDILKQTCDIDAQYMAGHSLGEYTALCAAEALDFQEAIKLVHMRGKIMQEAVPQGEGSMAAILGLADEDVIHVCNSVPGKVSAANFNAPGQVVIAGETRAVNAAIEAAKQYGAKRAVLLSVSVPSHCELMRAAAARFSTYLGEVKWHTPKATIIHNVDAKVHQDTLAIEVALGKQLYCPVRWTECVQTLIYKGVQLCIELGPGKVLTGLNKRIDRKLTTLAFDAPDSIETVKTALEKL